MRRFLKAIPLLGVLLAACTSPSPVDEIVSSNLNARGGMERLKALNTIRETGTVTASGGRVAKVVREIKQPDSFRLEFSVQGTKSVFAHHGEVGWQVAPLQGQFEPEMMTPETDSAAGDDQRDIEGPLVDWREKGHMVELIGRETLDSGEAFKLKLTLKDGSIRYDFVDVETRLIVRSDVTRLIRGYPVVLENTLSDFREIGGIVFPHHIESHAKDRPESMTIVIEKIELNPDLDDERFQFPE